MAAVEAGPSRDQEGEVDVPVWAQEPASAILYGGASSVPSRAIALSDAQPRELPIPHSMSPMAPSA